MEEQPTKKLFLAIAEKLSLSRSFFLARRTGGVGETRAIWVPGTDIRTKCRRGNLSLSLSLHPLPFVHRGKTQRLCKCWSVYISESGAPFLRHWKIRKEGRRSRKRGEGGGVNDVSRPLLASQKSVPGLTPWNNEPKWPRDYADEICMPAGGGINQWTIEADLARQHRHALKNERTPRGGGRGDDDDDHRLRIFRHAAVYHCENWFARNRRPETLSTNRNDKRDDRVPRGSPRRKETRPAAL